MNSSLLSQRDQSVIWHPLTQHHLSSLPLSMVRGEGAYLFDQRGKRYLDLISSWWVNIHGHGHPLIAKAIYEQALQLEQVIFSGFTHEPAVAVAEQLLTLLPPGFSKVFYTDNGSTAVEVAIKMAYQFWHNQGEKQRHRFLAFSGGYHGDTVGAMSMGQSSFYFKRFHDLLFSVDIAPYPATWMGDEESVQKENDALQWIENYFNQNKAEIAAVIIEPLIQGANGMQVCRPEFLRALEKVAREYDILVIYDEVMTGFYRTGAAFACKKAGTTPDIICLAKGLTGGFLPLAATACQPRIYQAFLHDSFDYALAHSHSYTANPLGCAAALASLQLLKQPSTLQQIQSIEKTHQEMLKWLAMEASTGIEKLRQCGTMAAFSLKEQVLYGSSRSQYWRERFLERGLLIRPIGNVIYLLPPYCIAITDLQKVYEDIVYEINSISR